MVILINLKQYLMYYIALIIVILDSFTKYLIRYYSPAVELFSFLSITFISNTGAAFGILKGYRVIFIIISLLVILAIVLYSDKLGSKTIHKVSFGLILGGTIGNLIDRFFLGYVVDFIAFSFWPAFNIADACLCIGVIILCIQLFREDKTN
jgi:signal peptidase II